MSTSKDPRQDSDGHWNIQIVGRRFCLVHRLHAEEVLLVELIHDILLQRCENDVLPLQSLGAMNSIKAYAITVTLCLDFCSIDIVHVARDGGRKSQLQAMLLVLTSQLDTGT